MGLAAALNTRVNGTVDEAHVYTPPVNEPLTPVSAADAPAESDGIPSTKKMAPYYSDERFVAELERMSKAAPFMLAHLYDADGAAQMERFVQVAERLHSLAILRQVSVVLDAD